MLVQAQMAPDRYLEWSSWRERERQVHKYNKMPLLKKFQTMRLRVPPPPGVEIPPPVVTHPHHGLVQAPAEEPESTKPAQEPTEPTELPPRSTQPICPLDGPYSHDIYEVFSDDGDPWQNGEPVRIQKHHGEPVRIQLRHGEPVRVPEPADIGTKARDLPVIRFHRTFWL